MKLRIVIFGLSITSSWGNGHATTFRALCAALNRRGHDITFFEKDVDWYASNRDLPEPAFADVQLYTDWQEALPRVRRALEQSDVALVGSYFPDGIPALQAVIDAQVPVKAFYDIDTPVTIAALRARRKNEYLDARLLPELDLYFSFTGGPLLRELEARFCVKRAVPLYCSFDPDTYRPRPIDSRFDCVLSYMGTYAPDRQPKIEAFLSAPARALPGRKVIVAGPMYPSSVVWPVNVEHLFHLAPEYHARLYSSSQFVLNVTRREMVIAGYSPSVRLFEAAACGATIISDNWPGLDSFFTPGEEVLLATSSDDVVRWLSMGSFPEIGRWARERVLAEHTSTIRAREFEEAICAGAAMPASRASA
jgi:spore maturation protein CgeB